MSRFRGAQGTRGGVKHDMTGESAGTWQGHGIVTGHGAGARGSRPPGHARGTWSIVPKGAGRRMGDILRPARRMFWAGRRMGDTSSPADKIHSI